VVDSIAVRRVWQQFSRLNPSVYRVGQKSDTSTNYITLYERYHFFGPPCIVLPCVAAVVSRLAWRMLVLLIARYVSNLINERYYYYYVSNMSHERRASGT